MKTSLVLLVLVAHVGYELFLENRMRCHAVLGFALYNSVGILTTLTVTEKPQFFSEAALSNAALFVNVVIPC